MKEDLFGYDRYRIPCKYLPYSRIDLDLNRPVTLPYRLYKAGRDPLECISYSIQSTEHTWRRVLRRSDGLNLSKSLVSMLVLPSDSYFAHLHRFIYYRGIPLDRLPTIFHRQRYVPAYPSSTAPSSPSTAHRRPRAITTSSITVYISITVDIISCYSWKVYI